MNTLIRALQFGDSMFPVGAFSFSGGLESAVESGIVTDRETLHEFVATAAHTAARCDGIALLHAHRAALAGSLDRVRAADSAVFQRKLNEEQRTMTARMGRKLAETGARVASLPLSVAWLASVIGGETPGTYPVGLGVLGAELALSESEAFAMHQYGTASMMVGAAVRLLRVSHFDTQSILFAVNASAADEYDAISRLTLDDMATFAPVTDVLAAVHVTAHVRMFMN
jgi:urease accessory protein